MDYLNAFWVGGLICLLGQILIDKTKMTPARILVTFVCVGVLLSLLGLYKPLADYAGAGATVPILGFGHALFQGVKKAVDAEGLFGALKGGLAAVSAGLAAAIFFGFLAGIIFKPKSR
ncbi:MAG: stage V sporulation protein AE [Clostridia bacterium]|nr:stage V sporulation protein AE [Clostridia bacterium]